ncbi:MAG TPA: hypothetical protein VF765_10910 [Polyangiaceae bacterium]
MSGDHDLWYVKTADGDVDRMTLDQLDDAFNAGRIDENVTVLPAGESNWVRLGTLLGLDQPATPSPVSFAPTYAPVPNSMRPVSIDLSDDQEFAPRKSRKGVGFAIAAAVLLIPAGILGANRMHLNIGGSSTPSVAAAAVVAPPPVTAAPPPPAPVAPPPATTAAATPSADNRFSDEQKAKLAAADKALDAKIKSKQKARAISGGGHGHSPKYKSQGFTSGGNKYDPLNSGI